MLRKWSPHGDDFVGDPIVQVVVPITFRSIVLEVAHEKSGHPGVKKTYDRVLRYFFFWPRVSPFLLRPFRAMGSKTSLGKQHLSFISEFVVVVIYSKVFRYKTSHFGVCIKINVTLFYICRKHIKC